jgi:hypothetical protein
MNFGSEIYGIAFTVLFNVAPLFQMVKIVRNRCSTNNSYLLWICGVMGQVCVLGYCNSLGVEGVFNYINSIMGLILNSIMIVMIRVYSKEK